MTIWRRFRTLWENVYRYFNYLSWLIFWPSIVILYPVIAVAGAVEFLVLDIPWLIAMCIEEGGGKLKSNIRYVYWGYHSFLIIH